VVVEDESVFTWEVKTKKVWAKKGSKPRQNKTGSKQKLYLYGAVTEDGRQLFRTYKAGNSDNTIGYFKELQKKFGTIILYTDRAPWHKSKEAQAYLYKHQETIQVEWFPSGWPELNPVEECWKQGKNDDDLGKAFYPKFTEFKTAVLQYYRTKRFHLNLYNYLC
jgi:transposase